MKNRAPFNLAILTLIVTLMVSSSLYASTSQISPFLESVEYDQQPLIECGHASEGFAFWRAPLKICLLHSLQVVSRGESTFILTIEHPDRGNARFVLNGLTQDQKKSMEAMTPVQQASLIDVDNGVIRRSHVYIEHRRSESGRIPEKVIYGLLPNGIRFRAVLYPILRP